MKKKKKCLKITKGERFVRGDPLEKEGDGLPEEEEEWCVERCVLGKERGEPQLQSPPFDVREREREWWGSRS